MKWRGLLEAYIHFRVTAGPRGVHSGGYLTNMALHDTPLRISKHYDRNRASLQILLRRHILVGGQEDRKSGLLGGLQQFPVNQLVPPGILRFGDGMTFQERNKRRGRALIKENAHQRTPINGKRTTGHQDCGQRSRARRQSVLASRRTTP